MDGFWSFASHYWWLIFPFSGAIVGGVQALNSNWNKASKRRHERAMERLRLGKPAIAALDRQRAIEARQQQQDALTASGAATAMAELRAEHEELDRRWVAYELDPSSGLTAPLMIDAADPLALAFRHSKRAAEVLWEERPRGTRSAPTSAAVLASWADAYATAVRRYQRDFDVAEAVAIRLGLEAHS